MLSSVRIHSLVRMVFAVAVSAGAAGPVAVHDSQSAARQELGLSTDAPLILFPYNPLRREKRLDLVDQSVLLLKKEFPDVQLHVTYNKPYRTVVNYMNACDVIVLTSDTVGAPMAIREAMACNLPIVSVDVGDVAKVIQNTEGCHVCLRSPDAIATKLTQVLRNRKRTNGRLAAEQFDLSKSASQVAMIYQELLGDVTRKSVSPSISHE